MNQLISINRIGAFLGRFAATVKALNSINQYGVNYLSETVLVPIFKEVFGLEYLQNLNVEQNNSAGIDIGDKINRVAFQITSTNTNEKIKHTLVQFFKNNLHESYDKLYIYVLTEKKNFYNQLNYKELLNSEIIFDDSYIIDYRDLLVKINEIQDYDTIQRIEYLLEKQFSENNINIIVEKFDRPLIENAISNLLEITFPDNLYIGDCCIDRNEVIRANRLSYKSTDREVIFAYKKQHNLRFSADWIIFKNKIISFHDLSNRSHDISKLVDLGTVNFLSTDEFYSIDYNHLKVFKSLLKHVFSKQVYYLYIDFYHQDDLFVFAPEDFDIITRKEKWHSGNRSAGREVIKVKLHKDSSPWYYTHLAFGIEFKFYSNKWFVEISPDWFITMDGKQKHFWQSEGVVSFLKRKERNQHVLNHLKFIVNYLKYGKVQSEFYDEARLKPRQFIKFLNLEQFNNHPLILEDDWKKNEDEEILKLMQDRSNPLNF